MTSSISSVSPAPISTKPKKSNPISATTITVAPASAHQILDQYLTIYQKDIDGLNNNSIILDRLLKECEDDPDNSLIADVKKQIQSRDLYKDYCHTKYQLKKYKKNLTLHLDNLIKFSLKKEKQDNLQKIKTAKKNIAFIETVKGFTSSEIKNTSQGYAFEDVKDIINTYTNYNQNSNHISAYISEYYSKYVNTTLTKKAQQYNNPYYDIIRYFGLTNLIFTIKDTLFQPCGVYVSADLFTADAILWDKLPSTCKIKIDIDGVGLELNFTIGTHKFYCAAVQIMERSQFDDIYYIKDLSKLAKLLNIPHGDLADHIINKLHIPHRNNIIITDEVMARKINLKLFE